MEKYLTQASDNIKESVAEACSAVMPGGHVGVCCQSKDRDYAQNVVEGISTFEYKITFIEYPDGAEANDDTSLDIVGADDDIRFFCRRRRLRYSIYACFGFSPPRYEVYTCNIFAGY